MALGVVGWRFSLLVTATLLLLLDGRAVTAREDCAVVASDRLLFYTIKSDCSIRLATGAIPSTQFKPSNATPCAEASRVRHGTFTRDANPGILVMYRNPESSIRDPSRRWIVHLIAVSPLPTAAFSMAIGDEDYFLDAKEEEEACGVGPEKSLLCVSSLADRNSLRLTRYEQRGQNYTPVASTTLPLRHDILSSDAHFLSLQQAQNGTIRVRVWSGGERKLTLITISPALVLQAVRKQLLRKEIGSVIAANDETTLARRCDEQGCRTLLRGAKDKGFHCVGASFDRLATLGVIALPPVEEGEQKEHRIQPRSTKGNEEEGEQGEVRQPNATERMFAEIFEVYETLPEFTQGTDETPSIIGGVQAIIVFLYLLVFTLVMFIKTVEEDGESYRFTTSDRAHLHDFDYIQQQEDAKKEKTRTTEEGKEVLAPAPVRQESSAPPSESGTSKQQVRTITASSGGPSPTATPVDRSASTTHQPVAPASGASSAESMNPTEDNFIHEEDAKAVVFITKKKPEQHSIGSMEAMTAAPPPAPAPRKLMQTEASGVSPDLTTASRVEPQPPPPPPAPVAALVPAPPQKSRSNLKPVPEPKPVTRRASPVQQRGPSSVMRRLPPTPPTCQHHYVSPGGFSTCTALCSQVADFNRQYAMGLGRSGAPLMADSNSDREQKE